MDHSVCLIHATTVEVMGYGILLRGPSGSGKSDLALRLMDEGAALVSDDQTELRRDGNHLTAHPPASIQGMMEVRGLGLFQMPFSPFAKVTLAVDLVDPTSIERLPDPDSESILGIIVPRLKLAAFHASTPTKLRLWIYAQPEFAAPLGVPPQPRLTPICKIGL